MARHLELMRAAIAHDGEGQRALLDGDVAAGEAAFAEAADLYRRSWEDAPPASYGRLVGMLKAAVLAGAGEVEATYVFRALGRDDRGSPTAAYALAIAALIDGDEHAAGRYVGVMRGGSEAFGRTADAIAALAAADRDAYAAAVSAIVRDFESRPEHLTGVAFADTALMLERLAAPREMAAGVESPLLPS
jgi:hypothetical protein